MTEPGSFRQRLDAVLRTMDVNQVRDFLITEHQWSEEAPADPETAMWMMIAGAASLRDLHGRAREWLVQHGHEREAEAILLQYPQSGSKKKGRRASLQPGTRQQIVYRQEPKLSMDLAVERGKQQISSGEKGKAGSRQQSKAKNGTKRDAR